MTLKPLIDQMIADSAHDGELAAGLQWIFRRATELAIDPYTLAEQIILEHVANKRAREWLHERRQSQIS